jgi:hypothetical protein
LSILCFFLKKEVGDCYNCYIYFSSTAYCLGVPDATFFPTFVFSPKLVFVDLSSKYEGNYKDGFFLSL